MGLKGTLGSGISEDKHQFRFHGLLGLRFPTTNAADLWSHLVSIGIAWKMLRRRRDGRLNFLKDDV